MKSPQFITDDKGNKISVIIPMEEYEKILEDLEELEDIRLYDEAKKEDDGTRISLSDYMTKRRKNA